MSIVACFFSKFSVFAILPFTKESITEMHIVALFRYLVDEFILLVVPMTSGNPVLILSFINVQSQMLVLS